MEWHCVKTMGDIRQFIQDNPGHKVSTPWKQMLEEMEADPEGLTQYDLDDFLEEGEYQVSYK